MLGAEIDEARNRDVVDLVRSQRLPQPHRNTNCFRVHMTQCANRKVSRQSDLIPSLHVIRFLRILSLSTVRLTRLAANRIRFRPTICLLRPECRATIQARLQSSNPRIDRGLVPTKATDTQGDTAFRVYLGSHRGQYGSLSYKNAMGNITRVTKDCANLGQYALLVPRMSVKSRPQGRILISGLGHLAALDMVDPTGRAVISSR